MFDIFSNILYIILFILCLSLLIVVHELGHLSAAKLFKVYCFEYSIGFGPKLFSKKRKKGETVFSIRAIPFGGYVSMYGEDVEVPEGLTIDKSRSLDGIKKWKRAIILFAGVFMNAILAIVIFFLSNTCFQQKDVYATLGKINDDSPLYALVQSDPNYEEGLLDIYFEQYQNSESIFILDPAAKVAFTDGHEVTAAMVLNGTTLLGYDKLDWDYYLQFYYYGDDGKTFEGDILPGDTIKDVTFSFSSAVYSEEEEKYVKDVTYDSVVLDCVQDEEGEYAFESLGTSFYLHSYYYDFGDAVKNTFVDFGDSASAIFKTLGSLFTSSEARDSVGGIVAIGFVSTDTLKNFGVNQFIRIWGMISVNLAIINLFPFPGLDGWQLLVLAVEGITKKEIPAKVKNIVSFVGLILLFGLMFLLVAKDVTQFIL